MSCVGAERQHVLLVAALEQRVRVLEQRRARRGASASSTPVGVVVARAPTRRSALRRAAASNVAIVSRERRRLVGLVREVEVDPLDAEPLEAALRAAGGSGPARARCRPASRSSSGRPSSSAASPSGRAVRAPARRSSARSCRRRRRRRCRTSGCRCSQARSMIANASSSAIPCPKNSGAEPMPPKLPQPSATPPKRHSGRFIRVRSFRTSQSSGKNEWWIKRPITSTGVPCVPITSPPITRCTTLK